MRKSYVGSVAISMLLVFGAAHADAGKDLRTTLAAMHADQPISIGVDVRSKVTSGDEDKPQVTQARARFSLHADAGQWQVTYPDKLLQRVDAESAAHAKDPDVPQPVRTLLDDVGPLKARTLADFAPSLLQRLEGATLESQSEDSYADKPAHLLVFKLPPGVASRNRDDIDTFEGHLKVWLGTDGVPLAISANRHYEGSKFFIDFEFGTSIAVALRRVGQRLVATRYHYTSSSAGMGQRGSHDTRVELSVEENGGK